MPRTPLHASLGESSPALDFELISRACAESVAERADLDWKRDLPLTARPDDREGKTRQQRALAKDIAAMANSGGGMIVFGVDEERGTGTSAASRIAPVGPVSEDTLRDIRRVAGNLIHPPVTGLSLVPLSPPDDPDSGVLVMLIPDSQDRPHLMHPDKGSAQHWFGAPYRDGPDTDWMRERQIAATYAERERGRRRREEDFETRYSDFTASLGEGTDLRWVVAFAVPAQVSTRPPRLTPQGAQSIFRGLFDSPLSSTIGRPGPSSSVGPADLVEHESTGRGLRRVVRYGTRELRDSGGAAMRARIEVHDDGALAVAFTRDGILPGEGRQYTQVLIRDLESTALDFLALLLQTRLRREVIGDYTARFAVHPPTEIFRRSDAMLTDHLVPWDGRRVLGYRPVDGPVIGSAGDEELVNSWIEIVRDAVNQAGAPCSINPVELQVHLWAES